MNKGWAHTDPILEAPMRGNHLHHRDIYELVCLWTTSNDCSPDVNGQKSYGTTKPIFDDSHSMLQPIFHGCWWKLQCSVTHFEVAWEEWCIVSFVCILDWWQLPFPKDCIRCLVMDFCRMLELDRQGQLHRLKITRFVWYIFGCLSLALAFPRYEIHYFFFSSPSSVSPSPSSFPSSIINSFNSFHKSSLSVLPHDTL